ncbi:hypothetical protein DHD05_18545 [Arenibacter sp. N53]|uniref:hypothetical protein n=1 Tax=Arenibacter TaxID=178469 RepID=UPI000CD43381|nr:MULTISPECIES: hypothetical protein [Arenibacter]MCM4153597.1 hypothetical protein [Arenibacter sp. N53]
MSKPINILLEIGELAESKNIRDSKKILDILMNSIYSLSIKHHTDPIDFAEQKYAKIIAQMIFTKLFNIRENLNGINFSNDEFHFKNDIIDTNLVANNIRNLFETVCLFNNFFIHSTNKDELILKLNIWEYSSLKYRLKLENQATNDEQKSLLQKDKHRLIALKTNIENSKIYNELNDDNKRKIRIILKNKDYKFSIINGEVKIYDWQKLADNFPDTQKSIPLLYTILSFYSHPTWKSVFDYGNNFKEEKIWIQNAQDLLRYSYILSSIFIIDFIKYFPNSENSFNKLKPLDIYLIEFYNYLVRGQEYLLDKDRFKE